MVLSSFPAGAQEFASDSAVRVILGGRIGARRGMGFVVAALERGKPPRIYTAGISGIAGLPLDSNTVFEIGSITKVFTTSLLADMVARGEVKLDDPVSKFLPRGVRVPSRGGKHITLEHLATQTSGLPRLPSNLRVVDQQNPYASYTVDELYQFLSTFALTRDPGSQYLYSNLGMGLLGHVLALRAGKSYETLLKERILDPLGMNDTRIELTPAMKSRMAQGFSSVGEPVKAWDLPTLAGAGALRSTAADMLRFLAASLDSTSHPLGRVLAQARKPRHDADVPRNRIGLGWNIVEVFGTTATWHNGGTGGFRAFIGIDEPRQRGVILLANASVVPDDIAFHLLEPKVPLDLAPAPTRPGPEIALDAAKLEAFPGTYEISPDLRITITKEGAALFAQGTNQPRFRLYAESETKFFLRDADAQITFVKDASGKVSELILHQGGANIPGKRVAP